MIGKEEINRRAKMEGLRFDQIEKDHNTYRYGLLHAFPQFWYPAWYPGRGTSFVTFARCRRTFSASARLVGEQSASCGEGR